MRKKRLLILFLQIGITAISAFLLLSYTNNQVAPTDVYMFTRDFTEIGEEVKATDIEKTTMPASAVSPTFATSEESIVGKRLDSKAKKGQLIYKGNLVELDEIDEFEVMDLTKYRKISLPIDFVNGISGNIKRGDKLDLVFTGQNKENDESVYSKVFLQNVLVYSINTEEGFKFVDSSNNYPGENTESEATLEQKLGIITLAVTLDEAEEIEARTSAGVVRYLARFDNSEDYETIGYTVNSSDINNITGNNVVTSQEKVLGE